MMFPLSRAVSDAIHDRPIRFGLLSKFFKRYRVRKRKILNENARDYLRSVRLRHALTTFMQANSTSTSIVEQAIGSTWRPFRVEHTLAGSLRGDVNLHSGTVTGTVSPNVQDSSSVVFLENDEGETLRVLVPSWIATKELFTRLMEEWTYQAGGRENFWGYGRESGGGYWSGTHTGTMLHYFARSTVFGPASNAQPIDLIDASCQKPAAERPSVRVFGQQIDASVVYATALELNGNMFVIIPTSFFKGLAEVVRKHIPNAREPRLITA